MIEKKRIIAIDVMKFIAALLITNSHMGNLYTHFNFLATGGAIGDALFFFCSGFTLFLGRERRFDNWYKRRVSRIYPTVIMWGVITAFMINKSYTLNDCILKGGGWFVSCIMIYYIIIYCIRAFFKRKLWLALLLASTITVAYYYLTDCYKLGNFYGEGSFRLVFFFLIMLLGAIIGQKYQSIRIKWPLLWFIVFIVIFYVLLFLKGVMNTFTGSLLNLLTIPCLGVICITLYASFNSNYVESIMQNKIGWIIRFIGGLCLEIYVVQHAIITTKINSIFPLNILIIFIAIVVAAYILKCLSRLFLQTFQNEDYNWKEIIRFI